MPAAAPWSPTLTPPHPSLTHCLPLSSLTSIGAEYGLLLATFTAILQLGLEGGIAAGVVLATLYFALAYARSQVDLL